MLHICKMLCINWYCALQSGLDVATAAAATQGVLFIHQVISYAHVFFAWLSWCRTNGIILLYYEQKQTGEGLLLRTDIVAQSQRFIQ